MKTKLLKRLRKKYPLLSDKKIDRSIQRVQILKELRWMRED